MRKPAAEHPDEYWDEVIEVNLNSQFVISREVGKHMIAKGKGKIIFIASLLTFQGGITVPGYAASKGAIGQLNTGPFKRVGFERNQREMPSLLVILLQTIPRHLGRMQTGAILF